MQRHTLRDGNWRHTGANDDAGADTPNADFGAISEASITTGALAGVTTVEVGSQSTSTWSHGG